MKFMRPKKKEVRHSLILGHFSLRIKEEINFMFTVLARKKFFFWLCFCFLKLNLSLKLLFVDVNRYLC